MLNALMLGLTALSSITGFSSTNSFDTSIIHLENVAQYLNETIEEREDGLITVSGVDYFCDLYTVSGENKYLEVSLERNGYLIYDKEDQIVLEYSPYKKSPFYGYEENFKIFNEELFDFTYVVYDDDFFYDLDTKLVADLAQVTRYVESLESTAGTYYRNIPVTSDAHIIDSSFYFENLGYRHAWNYNGTCTIVALEILLGYYDTFSSDLIIEDYYDTPTSENIGNSRSITSFTQSPGVDNSLMDDHDFHDYLCTVARDEVGDDPEQDGMTTGNQISLLKKYLSKRNVSYSLSTSEGNVGDIWTQRALGIIKDGIKSNRPVIANGSKHSVVAFAYDNDYVWAHTGWGWVGATPWSTFESGLFSNYSAGAIDLHYDGSHVHSDNYYSTNADLYICPCGVWNTHTTISPIDYGFEPQYFFYEKTKTFNVDSLTISTRRLRTGYIEDEYVNLSPKRQNAGKSFLELNFDKRVRAFDINLSYWQISDKLSPLNASATLEVKNTNGNWEKQLDLLNDVSLSTNRNFQESYIFRYIGAEIKGIRINVNSPATGTSNGGRISIGNLTLIHEIG